MLGNYNITEKNIKQKAGDELLEFCFTGYDYDCRDGYNQYGKLAIYKENPFDEGGYELKARYEAKDHIINRSWEAYDHQNVYMSCVRQLMDFRAGMIKDLVIKGAGKKRMTAALKPDFEVALASDEIYKAAERVLEELRK